MSGTCRALHMENVVFRYYENGKRNILDHVSLDIEEGGITVLMGGSGCGKSTLAAVAAGLFPENGGFLESGVIELYGHPVERMNQQERAGYLTEMFQNPDLQFCMDTLRREMQFCMENIRVLPQQMDERITAAARAMGMEKFLDRKLQTLSGGEKQRAALCCLFVMESRMILLDEPFANIDPAGAAELIRLIVEMKTQGRTVVVIDHQPGLWQNVADEIVVLGEGGVVRQRGITKDNLSEFYWLFEQEGLFYPGRDGKGRLSGKIEDVTGDTRRKDKGKDNTEIENKGKENIGDGNTEIKNKEIKNIEIKDTKIKNTKIENTKIENTKIGNAGVGQGGTEAEKRTPAVTLRDVSVFCERNRILLDHADAEFSAGCMTAVLGSSGSGKTNTFLSILKQHPYTGTIQIGTTDIKKMRKRDLFRQVGIVFQNPANQFITQNVREEIVSSLKIWRPELGAADRETLGDELLEEYGLKPFWRYSPYMLSQGQQRRLAVLSVLAGGQKILFLDEPTYGQDYRSTTAIMEQLRRKVEQEQLTVVFITHDMELAGRWADKIYCLEGKKLTEKNYCLEGKKLTEKNYCLEGKKLTEKNYCLEGKKMPEKNYCLGDQRLPEKHYFLGDQGQAEKEAGR